MTDAEIEAAVLAIVRGVLGAPEAALQRDTRARDVAGWDSVKMVEVILQTEEHFGITFRSREVDRLRNYGDLLDITREKLRAA